MLKYKWCLGNAAYKSYEILILSLCSMDYNEYKIGKKKSKLFLHTYTTMRPFFLLFWRFYNLPKS